jgi:hypothetical protein
MNEAPEKIWAGGREPEWFFDDPSDHRDGGYKEYTRTDIAQARIAELEAELHTMKTSGIIEVAVRNPSVSEYIAHWEGRAKKSEARIHHLKARIADLEALNGWYADQVGIRFEMSSAAVEAKP